MELNKLSLEKFTEATASGEPVPGGGSISALCGSLATSLASMVARLTIGKKKYADVQERISAILDTLSPLPARLLESVELDSEAYDTVFAAYKLPKETDSEKAARSEAIQKALKQAAAVPLDVAIKVSEAMPLIAELAQIGNRNAITDVYVAAMCARIAVLGASANVRINLMSITDEEFVRNARLTVELLEKEACNCEDCIRNIVMDEIS